MHLNPTTGAFEADCLERIPFLYTTVVAGEFGGYGLTTNASAKVSGQALYCAKGGEVVRNLNVKLSANANAGGFVLEIQKSTDGGTNCAALATPISATVAAGSSSQSAAGPSSALAQFETLWVKTTTVNLAGGTVVTGYFEIWPS
jgi:hypothetical protein